MAWVFVLIGAVLNALASAFIITLDNPTFRPMRLIVTAAARISRESLPQYVNKSAFMA